ncbi:SDR family oxidoreductase [Longimicrobium sp.]|uniref:SDR family oxidoreductase n=1 Tax=Longimicrobium sp. TaxID=2029185 RepID=UPI002BC0AE37|nr:SDR family oxidoreductase [Longimicrobium sp.]HSU17101.1 SDR family oxidoreductase [Longimicrobium sp.]
MTRLQEVRREVRGAPRTWLVTGAAGFIGSALVEELLSLGQRVVGLDNFSTGSRGNLLEAAAAASGSGSGSFHFVEGDLCRAADLDEACRGVDVVLHQAALGSVPRSIDDPEATHRNNVDGFVNLLQALRRHGVRRLVYASSSSVYGDHPALPKVEEVTGAPLSPYAASKVAGELYAGVFARVYGIEAVGLRYFNVFGRRQSPEGPYAAVIPRWVRALLKGEPCVVYGDGETSRDFCYVDNVVQANLLAAAAPAEAVTRQVFNVAGGECTTLAALFAALRDGLAPRSPAAAAARLQHADFRPGDVRHSLASIDKARRVLGYAPTHTVAEGLRAALDWYVADLSAPRDGAPPPVAAHAPRAVETHG